ncbi:MAG: sigma-54-dependent Fis family transcriptional regulator [Betaproteobacteria bacterium]|jgi:two-component system, NtrC family, response regulator AtoC|nr:MAG: sigma-54-dependent Fis family transcriptional regulator [Betaproteobacteria bacterium]PZO23783.1 MAG: sigma-54-dependent Fis family transcriptional regulator [Betaproteobacteria bacterium]
MNRGLNVLLLEDDPALQQLIVEELESEGFRLTACDTVAAAKQTLQSGHFDLLVTDLRLPDGDGMDMLKAVQAQNNACAVIVITAFGSVRQAVKALQAGADDFLTKPLDLEHLLLSAKRVLANRALRSELQQYRQLNTDHGFHGIFGKSPAMNKLIGQIRMLAEAQGPVLILGESGTGKELIARALHAESPRADKPFLAVNCAGIPAELLESEFFGHASGSFTGAKTGRKGLLQQADGGTLLLDEIGEMPLMLQAKLLRALQDGWIRPVGEDREVQVDVRILAATHQDLRKAVEEGRFREDLYYRLETFALHVPPVRDREDDIDLLALRFLKQSAIAQQKQVKGFTAEALKVLKRYRFPGNVRELQNVVERAVVFCHGDSIALKDLPDRVQSNNSTGGLSALPAANGHATHPIEAVLLEGQVWPTLDEMQKRYVQLILKEVDGNKRRAAALLGIGRRTLYRWLGEDDL